MEPIAVEEECQVVDRPGNAEGQGGCLGGKDHEYTFDGTEVSGGSVYYIYKCDTCGDVVRQKH